jgi:hypothetical protein
MLKQRLKPVQNNILDWFLPEIKNVSYPKENGYEIN